MKKLEWSQELVDIVFRAAVYDRSYGMEPEALAAEPGVMGVSHRGYDVGARGYDRSYGVEPLAMTGVYGVRARGYVVRSRDCERGCEYGVSQRL